MIFLRDNYGTTSIIFYDDLFFPNYRTINEDIRKFCKMLEQKRINMKWQIEMRPDFFVELKERSLDLLYRSGCTQINLGIEKMTERGLRFLGKTGNRDGLNEKMNNAKKIGISLCATFILGGKDEKEDDIVNLVDYAKSLPIDFAQFNPLFVYPGTSLYDDIFSSPEEWVEEVLSSDYPWGEIVYENEYLKTRDLLRLVDYAYAEFYKNSNLAEDIMIKDRFNLKRMKEK